LGAGLFITIYDWDTIELETSNGNVLSIPVVLCSGIFPCSISIQGDGIQSIQRTGNGSIICLGSAGCIRLSISRVHVVCKEYELSTNPVLEVQGSLASIRNSSFTGCYYAFDGSSIRAYDKAVVHVKDSSFIYCRSLGLGGAISAFGSTVFIEKTLFKKCTSFGGGGAVSVATFVCYGSTELVITSLIIDKCQFQGCSTDGLGGAVFASSGTSTIYIYGSSFVGCTSWKSGGAVAAVDSAKIDITVSLFANNSAHGLGGGAIFSQDAIMALRGLACNGNAAIGGGGGVIYWQGTVVPSIKPWCESGWYIHPRFQCIPSGCEYKCQACNAGKFQTKQGSETERDCTLCEAGKYSSTIGSSTCMDCSPGTFSSSEGASDPSDCILCYAGSYSESVATSECSLCDTGAFSSCIGSTLCIQCQAGEFSTLRGANESYACISCAAGTYSFTGAEECLECESGTFSSLHSSACAACSAGTYSTVSMAIDNASCVLCEPGTFSKEGASLCSSCGPGTFSSAEGRTSPEDCSSCEAGTYSVIAGATSSSTCAECGAGSYSGPGALTCFVCRSGKYSTAGRAESSMTCLKCLSGSFSVSGSALCLGIGSFRQERPIPLLLEDNFELLLPFDFSFNQSNYRRIHISRIGEIHFGSSNDKIFTTIISNSFTDTVFSSGGAMFYDEDISSFLIFNDTSQFSMQWTNLGVESNCYGILLNAVITFQVSLFQNGSLIMSYLGTDVKDFEETAPVIGIQSVCHGALSPSSFPVLFPGQCLHIFPEQEQYQNCSFETYRCPENLMIAEICQPGTFLSANMLCAQCVAGKFQTGSGMTFENNCSLCIAGKYSNTAASSAAELCLNCSDLFLNSSHDQGSLRCDSLEIPENREEYQRHEQKASHRYLSLNLSNSLPMESITGVFTNPRYYL
jgi:predicted outer membrane repeat protein